MYTSNGYDETQSYFKLSAHVVALGYFGDWRLCKVANAMVRERLLGKIVLGEPVDGASVTYVDATVYSSNQEFRLLGSTKSGDRRFKTLVGDWVYSDGLAVEHPQDFAGQFLSSLVGRINSECYEIERCAELAERAKKERRTTTALPCRDDKGWEEEALDLLNAKDPGGGWSLRIGLNQDGTASVDRHRASRCIVCPGRTHEHEGGYFSLRDSHTRKAVYYTPQSGGVRRR